MNLSKSASREGGRLGVCVNRVELNVTHQAEVRAYGTALA